MRQRRRLVRASAAAVVALAPAGLGAAAGASTWNTTPQASTARLKAPHSEGGTNVYVFRNRGTQSCLALNSAAGVTQGSCGTNTGNVSNRLRWEEVPDGVGYELRSMAATGQCLVSSSIPVPRAGKVATYKVATLPCGDGHRSWKLLGAPLQVGDVLQNTTLYKNTAGLLQQMCLNDTGRFGVTLQPCTPHQQNNNEAWYQISSGRSPLRLSGAQ
jgi:hypothetical protein